MNFAASTNFWLLALIPVFIGLSAFAWRRRLRTAAEWAARGLWDRLFSSYEPRRLTIASVLLTITLVASITGLARPRWGTSEQTVERRGVDLVFVLDTSLSMATNDVSPSRIWVAQTLIRRLVQELPGHRMGLVQAEGDGVILAPLTTDSAVIDLLLDSVLPGSLPTPGTDLDAALERALELFSTGGDKHRALILVSDGEDHGSGLDSIVDKMHDLGVIVHAIGVGTREGKPLEVPNFEDGSGALEYKRDDDGKVVVSKLIETTLETLSRETNGTYTRARSAAAELGSLIARIESMEKTSFGNEFVNTLEERFQWPLAVAILCLIGHCSYAPFRRQTEDR